MLQFLCCAQDRHERRDDKPIWRRSRYSNARTSRFAMHLNQSVTGQSHQEVASTTTASSRSDLADESHEELSLGSDEDLQQDVPAALALPALPQFVADWIGAPRSTADLIRTPRGLATPRASTLAATPHASTFAPLHKPSTTSIGTRARLPRDEKRFMIASSLVASGAGSDTEEEKMVCTWNIHIPNNDVDTDCEEDAKASKLAMSQLPTSESLTAVDPESD